MKMISGIFWDKGMRADNQDSAALHQVMTRKGRVVFAAVCDGIGGLEEGQVASGYIIEKLAAVFYGQLLLLIGKGKRKSIIKKCILRCLHEVNRELNAYAAQKNIKLGATVSLLVIWRRHYVIFHLGDSRIYQCGSRKTQQLTIDHSDANNRLLKCLGSFPFQYPDIQFGRIWRNKGFLLCTDGFSRRMDVQDLKAVLNPKEITQEMQIDKRLRRLGEAVLKKGEQDNISAVYVQVS